MGFTRLSTYLKRISEMVQYQHYCVFFYLWLDCEQCQKHHVAQNVNNCCFLKSPYVYIYIYIPLMYIYIYIYIYIYTYIYIYI